MPAPHVTAAPPSRAPSGGRCSGRRTLTGVGLILLAYAVVAWSAVSGKSSTADEPVHASSAWLWWHKGEVRVDAEQPLLWKYLIGLPTLGTALSVDEADPLWQGLLDAPNYPAGWWVRTLYQTPGNDGEQLVSRSRLAALTLAFVTLGLASWWAWRLRGGVAAVATALLLGLDPTFLAHGPLVKNDLPLGLAALAASYAAWRAGVRLSPWNAAAVVLCCVGAFLIKLNGLLVPLVVAVLLLVRALADEEWEVLGYVLRTRLARCLTVGLLGLVTLLAGYGLTWAAYGFRFGPSPEPRHRLDHTSPMRQPRLFLQGRDPFAYWQQDRVIRTVGWIERHRLLPQPLLYAFVYQRVLASDRKLFLLDERRTEPVWWGLPFAYIVKTPLTLQLVLVVLTAAWLRRRSATRAPDGSPRSSAPDRWDATCIALPLGLLGLATIAAAPNPAVRYLLTVLPLLYLLAGLGVARLWERARGLPRASLVRGAMAGGAVLLAVESLSAWPNFIPYFNLAAGGSRGGLSLLGDSNLDWGQDLPALRDWQRRHPEAELYFCYFGAVDPHFYGLSYHEMPGSFPNGDANATPTPGSYVAVSATNLQGIYFPPHFRSVYRQLLRRKPVSVLGGSIYVYRMD